MAPTPPHEHTELRGRDAAVTITYDRPDHADIRVWTDGEPGAAPEAARLACEAIHQARVRDALRVETALDASTEICGVVLEALRRRRGNDLDGFTMRRAGTSVMVTLVLRPWPTLSRMPVDRGVGHVPTQPGHWTRVSRPVRATPAVR